MNFFRHIWQIWKPDSRMPLSFLSNAIGELQIMRQVYYSPAFCSLNCRNKPFFSVFTSIIRIAFGWSQIVKEIWVVQRLLLLCSDVCLPSFQWSSSNDGKSSIFSSNSNKWASNTFPVVLTNSTSLYWHCSQRNLFLFLSDPSSFSLNFPLLTAVTFRWGRTLCRRVLSFPVAVQ